MNEPPFVEFCSFRIDLHRRLLLKNDRPIKLSSKAFDMLIFLVQNSGRLVGKEELLDSLWPETFVEESNLAVTISAIRKVLGEARTDHRYIVTVPKYGYRFVAPVTGLPEGDRRRFVSDALGQSDTKHIIRSVAILPFRSRGEDLAHLGLGIAESLLTRLSQIKGTIVRAASGPYLQTDAEKDVVSVGRQLGVKSVVDGTIQQLGDRLRVTARLVRIRDGAVVWAEQFDENSADVFTVEDSVADRITQALMAQMIVEDNHSPGDRTTESPKAYHSYLKGRFFWERRTEETLTKAIDCFKQAIQEDLGYASAYLGLADCYHLLTYFGALPPPLGYQKVKAAAMKALDLDAALGVAHTTLACVHLFYDWDGPLAMGEFQRAIELDPDHPRAHHWFSQYFMAVGDLDKAMSELQRARDLDPLSLMIHTNLALGLYFARRYVDAVAELRTTIEMDPHFAVAHWALGLSHLQMREWQEATREFRKALSLAGENSLILSSLGHAYAASGLKNKARSVLNHLNRLSSRRYVSPYNLAIVHAGLGDNDRAFEWLRKALDDRSSWLVYLHLDPLFDKLKSDRRFSKLVRSVGLLSMKTNRVRQPARGRT
jgi:DNA-binding winged helix-turn-helix (wHTH) protein/tetratricopeptide (TPR) repeat protein